MPGTKNKKNIVKQVIFSFTMLLHKNTAFQGGEGGHTTKQKKPHNTQTNHTNKTKKNPQSNINIICTAIFLVFSKIVSFFFS